MGGQQKKWIWLKAASLGALLPSASLAADLPVKAAPPPVVAVYNWTGFYVGAHVGYGHGMKDWRDFTFDYQVQGFLGGGQIGYNQQVGNVVFGIEADASWAGVDGHRSIDIGGPLLGGTQTLRAGTTIDGLATLTGRLGLAQDRWLVYVKGGAAWVREKHDISSTSTFGAFTQTLSASGTEDRVGYTFGIGSEWALSGNWSLKSEYNYVHLNTRRVNIAGSQTTGGVTTPTDINIDIKQALHLAKFGVNYRFGPAAPQTIAPGRPAPGYNWTGAWIGAQAGYSWGSKNWPDLYPNGGFNIDGWLGGLSTGANVQAGLFVVGAESEWLYADINGARRDVLLVGPVTQTTDLASKVDWLWLNSVRVGFVPANNWLVYAKGGLAVAHERHDIGFSQVQAGLGSVVSNFGGNALHTGWLGGLGAEYAFFGNWSAKLEYNYVRFEPQDALTSGTQTINIPAQSGTIANIQKVRDIRQDMHFVKFGINYHFNALPSVVTAKF